MEKKGEMFEEDLEHLIIKVLQELNHLYEQCQRDQIKAGIKFNLTYPISLEEHMEQTIFKP